MSELSHAEHVRDLALVIFDRTQPAHKLGEPERHLLEIAALMHDLPPAKGKKDRLKAALDMLRSQTQDDLPSETSEPGAISQDGGELAALIILSSGKKLPHNDLAVLVPEAVRLEVLQILAALLHIAAGLDDSRSQTTHILPLDETLRPAASPGGLWLVVDGPSAVADAEVARHNTRLWEKAGFAPLVIVAASVSSKTLRRYPPLPQPLERMGIRPEDTMSEAGRKVWLYQFAEMLRNEEGTRQGEDIEALHDMRVATRRMRAAFEVFGDFYQPAVLKPHLRGLRQAGRALGQVRDLDVFMEKADHYLQTLPKGSQHDLDPLLVVWHERREQARAEMLAHLDSEAYQAFKWEFNRFLQTPDEGELQQDAQIPSPALVREVAPVLVYERLAAVRAYDRVVRNASVIQLHALRIEFKKFRYTLEFFREVLGDETKAVINDLKAIQDHLGDLNDAEVATTILRQFLDQWFPQTEAGAAPTAFAHQDPQGIVTYLAARFGERHTLISTFNQVWTHFNRDELRRNLALSVSVL